MGGTSPGHVFWQQHGVHPIPQVCAGQPAIASENETPLYTDDCTAAPGTAPRPTPHCSCCCWRACAAGCEGCDRHTVTHRHVDGGPAAWQSAENLP